MGQKLSLREAELYKRSDEVLHYVWDPIGVAGVPAARDEYHSYLPQVFGLVRDLADRETIAAYLVTIETERMGLPGKLDAARAVADILLDWREWI